MQSIGEGVSAAMKFEWHECRSRCDVNASEAGEACGLGYNSRAEWVGVRLGERLKKEEDSLLLDILERGRQDQAFAEFTYVSDANLLKLDERMLPEAHYRRQLLDGEYVWNIGATPDAIVIDALSTEKKRAVEYKCAQNDGEGVCEVPKPGHLLQVIVQLYVLGIEEGHLFYYRRSSGQYRCFRVRSSDEKFLTIVWPWIREALEMRSSRQARMPNGEAKRRSDTLYREFL